MYVEQLFGWFVKDPRNWCNLPNLIWIWSQRQMAIIFIEIVHTAVILIIKFPQVTFRTGRPFTDMH